MALRAEDRQTEGAEKKRPD